MLHEKVVPIEMLKMRKLLRRIFVYIKMANPRRWASIPQNELEIFIKEHADTCLERFGLELCESVAIPILNLDHIPFNEESDYLSFYDLCKHAQLRKDQEGSLEIIKKLGLSPPFKTPFIT